MKTIQTIITLLCIVFFSHVNAQHKMTEAEKERAANKVQIYTSTERDNLQMWFHERVAHMQLTEKQEEEYFSVILYYKYKITRLNDKDMELSEEEVLSGIDDYVLKINKEVTLILSKEQYQIHLESFNTLLTSIHNRMNEE